MSEIFEIRKDSDRIGSNESRARAGDSRSIRDVTIPTD